MSRLVVVGGGISGLAAAWAAAEAGFEVTVLEASPRIGGKLRIEEVGGIPIDVGAEALLAARPEGVALLAEAGLDAERVVPLTTAASIRAGGRNHPLPARTFMGIPSDLTAVEESGALTPAGLAAAAAEPDLPPLPPLADDVAVGPLVRARFGGEVLDRLVEPLLGGVYAGRADELSLRATARPLAEQLAREGGSLLAAVRAVAGKGTRAPDAGPVFVSVRGGLGRLPSALAAAGRFEIRTSMTVRSITRTPSGFALDCGAVPATERVTADAVVVAVPPAKAGRLLSDVAPTASAELAGIPSASVAIVSFAYDPIELPAGSGLLVGAGERLAVKGVTFSSSKWPLDADGRVLLRASVGRAGEPQALQFDDAELIALVRRELRALAGVTAEPVDARVTRWGGALPQYAVGHVERIARIRAAVAGVPGLGVCGAAFDGVGIPACIAAARQAVAMVANQTRMASSERGE